MRKKKGKSSASTRLKLKVEELQKANERLLSESDHYKDQWKRVHNRNVELEDIIQKQDKTILRLKKRLRHMEDGLV
jgi:predicted nuclease with TOPRIM domain